LDHVLNISFFILVGLPEKRIEILDLFVSLLAHFFFSILSLVVIACKFLLSSICNSKTKSNQHHSHRNKRVQEPSHWSKILSLISHLMVSHFFVLILLLLLFSIENRFFLAQTLKLIELHLIE